MKKNSLTLIYFTFFFSFIILGMSFKKDGDEMVHPKEEDMVKNTLTYEGEVFFIKPNGQIVFPKKNGNNDSQRRSFKKGANTFIKIRDKGISILRFEFPVSVLNTDTKGNPVLPEFVNGTDGFNPVYQFGSLVKESTTRVEGDYGRLDLVFIREKDDNKNIDSLMVHVHGHVCDPILQCK